MDILSHQQIWLAIDRLAEHVGISVSGLAKRAGLDPTTFNKSKRFTGAGRERWPSTESIAKILRCTNTSTAEFMSLISGQDEIVRGDNISYRTQRKKNSVPLIGFAQAGAGGYFDDGGFPVGQGWEKIEPPGHVAEHSYALKVSGDSMMPLYREGDILVVDPVTKVRKGDRVVVKTSSGEVMAKTLARQTSHSVSLNSLNPEHPDLEFPVTDIEWIARIVWASQ